MLLVKRPRGINANIMRNFIKRVILKAFSSADNAYRVPNGFRPRTTSVQTLSLVDLEHCHEIIRQKRQRK